MEFNRANQEEVSGNGMPAESLKPLENIRQILKAEKARGVDLSSLRRKELTMEERRNQEVETQKEKRRYLAHMESLDARKRKLAEVVGSETKKMLTEKEDQLDINTALDIIEQIAITDCLTAIDRLLKHKIITKNTATALRRLPKLGNWELGPRTNKGPKIPRDISERLEENMVFKRR